MYGARTGLPLPEPAELEELAVLVLERMFNPPLGAQRMGRSGQKQYGIDVKLRSDTGKFIGAQCKRYLTTRLTAGELQKEVAAAAEIEPPLDGLIIVTTLPNDAKLQTSADKAVLHGKHAVSVWFEDDLKRYLDEYNLGDRLFDFARPRDLAASYERQTGMSISGAVVGVLPGSTRVESELHELLLAGRPQEALRRLDLATSADVRESQRRLIRIKALYALEHYADCVSLADSPLADAGILAIGGLAAADLGEPKRAAQFAAKAASSAKTDAERVYVTGLGLLIAARTEPTLTYEDLIGRVPESLLTSTEIAPLLGDVAMSRERYEEAVGYFEVGMTSAHGSPMRVLPLATALVALAVERLPAGWVELLDDRDRALAERGRAQLEVLRTNATPVESSAQKALLSNLAIANSLLGDIETAMRRAREAVDVDVGDAEMWQRWIEMALRRAKDVDLEAIATSSPLVAEVQLAVGRLAELAGSIEVARRAYTAAFSDTSSGQRAHVGATYALKRLNLTTAADGAELRQALEDLSVSPFAVGGYVIEALRHPDWRGEEETSIAELMATAASKLPNHEAAAMAAMLRDHGHALSAAPLLPILRGLCKGRGNRLDPSVADLLIDVLIANRRYQEADTLSAEWVEQKSGRFLNASARRSQCLSARGQFALSWDTHARAIQDGLGRTSPSLLESFAHLSRSLGRLREGKRIVRAQSQLPETNTPGAYRRLLSALTILHDPRVRSVLLAGSQGALIDPEFSGSVFALAIEQRAPRPVVTPNAAVTLRDTETGGEHVIWLGPREVGPHAASPVAFDAEWLEPLRGRTLGDMVRFTAGPFAGRSFVIRVIRHPQHLLAHQAHAVAIATGLQAGGIDTVSAPNIDQLVERMREQLRQKQDFTQSQLQRTQSLGLPSSAAACMFGTSPREFLQKNPGWTPLSGQGTEDTVRSEDASFNAGRRSRFVLDPSTLLLIVSLGAESLVKAAPVERFVVTPQTVGMLYQWYLLERRSVRSRGTMSLGKKGRLHMHEHGSGDRRAHWAYWRRVRQYVVAACEIVEGENDDIASRGALLERGVDTATLSAIALAEEREWVLVAEEAATRNLANALGLEHVTSLQRVILRAGDDLLVRRTDSIQWLAGLIELGWHYVVLPFWAFRVVHDLPVPYRRRTCKLLYANLRTALPQPATVAVVSHLASAQSSVRGNIDQAWLRRTALRGLPRGKGIDRAAFKAFMRRIAGGRNGRSLRRAVARWLDKHHRREV